jgi:excinuclease UvrABC nuclease subunit
LSPEDRAALIEELRQAMEKAAKDLDFEQAARLRDRLYELERGDA